MKDVSVPERLTTFTISTFEFINVLYVIIKNVNINYHVNYYRLLQFIIKNMLFYVKASLYQRTLYQFVFQISTHG
jgi:hypothetical protein